MAPIAVSAPLTAIAAPTDHASHTGSAGRLTGCCQPDSAGTWKPASEQERVNYFDEYRRRTPEKIIGGSIYLFREDGR